MDRLFYFSRSADRPPGQGANEWVADPKRYTELARTPGWRQMLSNFWVAPFVVQGVNWNSVEHFFQGHKINLASPQQGLLFSLNSGSELSRSGGDVAQKNRKMVVLTPQQLQQWEQIKNGVMYAALKAKFSQSPTLRRILLSTGEAELWHSPGRAPAGREMLLERVRAELRGTALSFEEATGKISRGEVSGIEVIPGQPNSLLLITGTDGAPYSTRVQYDPATNHIFPPV